MKIWKSLAIIALIFTQHALADGGSLLGPHDGYLTMPGTYHVEVIPGKDFLAIMLLDSNLKNPTVLNSHIKVKIKNGKNSYVLRCESMDNYFSCPVSEKMMSRQGTLVIQSARQLAEGDPVEYPLPLKFSEEKLTA